VVVLDNYNMEYLIELNKAVRSNKVGFVYGGSLGLYGFTFVDFGDNHVVTDESGE
jgi:molybdopterin/thiamine biosynthesis adenylyltransferase